MNIITSKINVLCNTWYDGTDSLIENKKMKNKELQLSNWDTFSIIHFTFNGNDEY